MPRYTYKKTKKFFSLNEAVEMMEEEDEELDVESVVIIPPENAGNVTDEEEGEDDVRVPHDVPGTIEVDYSKIGSADIEQEEHDTQKSRN